MIAADACLSLAGTPSKPRPNSSEPVSLALEEKFPQL